MDLIIRPGKLSGQIEAIPSKSQAHRILICAAFSDKQTRVICPISGDDILATVSCLRALGASIEETADGYLVTPVSSVPAKVKLDCGESGSTLRFLLPIAGALGIDATFIMHGNLPNRPLKPLLDEMERMGCKITRNATNSIRCQGKLNRGNYRIDGNISSQFITGLMLAISIMGSGELNIIGEIQSQPYIEQTKQVLSQFGARFSADQISAPTPLISPEKIYVEGDWSNGAYFLAAAALGNNILVSGLPDVTTQGDAAIKKFLVNLQDNCEIDIAQIPDLMPMLAVAAGALKGATFVNIHRLRTKESDRVAATAELLATLGIHTTVDQDQMTVYPGKYHGGTVDSHNDHRIAMCAAIASTLTQECIVLQNAECVNKSYPNFWEDFRKLGGHYEQYLR